MGKPKLEFKNSSGPSNVAFMRFLFKREWKDMGDPELSSIGMTMLVFIICFKVGFLMLFILEFLGYAPEFR